MPVIQDESRVTGGFAASVPAAIRRRLGIEPGDTLLWRLEEDRLVVAVRKARERSFAGFEPYDIGAATDAVREHDEIH